MGGDIVYNVPKKALRPVERGMIYRAQVAHTRDAKKHGRRPPRPTRAAGRSSRSRTAPAAPPDAGTRRLPPRLSRADGGAALPTLAVSERSCAEIVRDAPGSRPCSRSPPARTPSSRRRRALARATEKLESLAERKDTRLHGRLRRAETVSRRQRQAETAAAGEKRVVFFGDSITDMWPLATAFPGKPYVNRGIARPDDVADAGALPRRRDRAGAQGGRHPGGHQRHRRQHRPDLARGHPGQLRDHGRAGARARHPRRAVVGDPGAQLHAGVGADVPAPAARADRRAEQVAEGLRRRRAAASTSTTPRPCRTTRGCSSASWPRTGCTRTRPATR